MEENLKLAITEGSKFCREHDVQVNQVDLLVGLYMCSLKIPLSSLEYTSLLAFSDTIALPQTLTG